MRKEWIGTDYYSVLGVSRDASAKSIKKAYRKLAQELHPDTNTGDKAAESRFKEVSEAYDVIGDNKKRPEYDKLQRLGPMGGGFAGRGRSGSVTFEDLYQSTGAGSGSFDMLGGLGDLFGGGRPRNRPGHDISTSLAISFHEGISGTTKEISIDGERIKVRFPKGTVDGAKLRLRGKGGYGSSPSSPRGDLYVDVQVGSHPIFDRHGIDLLVNAPITFVEATLGANITVPTLDGKVTLKIPPATQTGKIFSVKGRGVIPEKGDPGNLLVTVTVVIPADVTAEQQALLKKFADNNDGPGPREHLGV